MDAGLCTQNVTFFRLLQEIHNSGIDISVTVTAKASVVREWLTSALYSSRHYVHLKRLVVGLSVQPTLSGGGERSPAVTLQLCIGRRCLIFQLAHATTVPEKLRTFLLNPSHTFVGLWNYWDQYQLSWSRHRLRMAVEPLDLSWYAKIEAGGDVGPNMETMIERCLGIQIEPEIETARSNWRDQYLSDDQMAFASVRALCAFLIGLKCRAWES